MFMGGLVILLAVFLTGSIGGMLTFGPDNSSFANVLYTWLM